MISRLKNGCSHLLEHYLVTLLLLTLIVMTLNGVSNARAVGLLGVLLCTAGITQGEMRIDLRALIPLLVFDLCSMASSIRLYHTPAAGFAATQTIFTVIYLLMAHLDDGERRSLRRACVAWVGCTAGIGVLHFSYLAQVTRVSRLGGLLGNPNAFGIFLVLGWFALETDEAPAFLRRLEPIILAALALTLSMGSFVAMAVGILIMLLAQCRRDGLKKTLPYACRVLARAVVGVGIGLLLYIAGRKTDVPQLCFVLVLYLGAAVVFWPVFRSFLEDHPRATTVIAVFGVVVAGVTVAIRPSAIATFSERLEMMRNGLSYILKEPLFGIGPYQWRLLNYYDADTYFNTWHIHNLFIHVGVELGLIAMAALIVLAVRHFCKKGGSKAGTTAFLIHSMMDTGFFYETIPGLVLMTAARPRNGGQRLNAWTARAIFLGLGVFFVCVLIRAM